MTPKPPDRGRLVYSTDFGRMCPECRRPQDRCVCARTRASAIPEVRHGDGIVRVRRETQGRSGKTVTTIDGLALGDAELATLAKELKQRCGAGGAVKAGVIELQGDHRERVVAELGARGYVVKLAGG